ncbi:MAG: hypothetical protein JXR13_18770 [Thalassovita sp.]
MPLNLPAPPSAPDLNQPDTYNADVLAGFQYVFTTLPAYLSGVEASDWFDVQANNYDTTPGRLLINGAFGIGGGAPSSADAGITDFNDLITGGVWTISGAMDNGPSGTGSLGRACLVLQRRFSSGVRVTQILSENSAEPQLWVRVATGDPLVWSDWRPLTPTRGSNANGEYVRFSDGTQICWSSHTITHNSGNRLEDNWNFPAAFISAPEVTATLDIADYIANANADPGNVSGVFSSGKTATSVKINLYTIASVLASGDSAVVDAVAVGRWF